MHPQLCVQSCRNTPVNLPTSSPVRASSEMVVLLPGSRWWGVINFCATPSLPSAGPLPPVFMSGSHPGHSCYFLFFWCCCGSVSRLYCRLIGTHKRESYLRVMPSSNPPNSLRHYAKVPLLNISYLLYIPSALLHPREKDKVPSQLEVFSWWLNKWARAGSENAALPQKLRADARPKRDLPHLFPHIVVSEALQGHCAVLLPLFHWIQKSHRDSWPAYTPKFPWNTG